VNSTESQPGAAAKYGLIFDVDGVLADTEPCIAEASIEMFRDLYGLSLIPDDFRPFIGTGAARYVEGPAEDFGITIDTKRAIAVRHDNFVRIINARAPIAFAGAKGLVEAVHADGNWALAIATSSPAAKFEETLKAAGIPFDMFVAVVTGDRVTHKKPDPEIYHTAAEALGLPPAACVVIEDAVTGVAAAKAAGMKCIAFASSFSAQELAQADRIVDALSEIGPDLLNGLVTGAP